MVDVDEGEVEAGDYKVPFDITDDGALRTPAGFGLGEVASGARGAFLLAVGKSVKDWSALPESTRERWMNATEVLLETVRLTVEVAWSKLAKRMYFAHSEEDKWEDLPKAIQIAWEAAARQAVNYMVAEDSSDVREVQEMDWRSWASRRLAE